MNTQEPMGAAKMPVVRHKCSPAMGESSPAWSRFACEYAILLTEEARTTYRELIVTAPDPGENINAAILYDETIPKRKTNGTL